MAVYVRFGIENGCLKVTVGFIEDQVLIINSEHRPKEKWVTKSHPLGLLYKLTYLLCKLT